MQPEARFKQKLIRSFEKHFPKPESWHTAIVARRGQISGMPDLIFGLNAPNVHVLLFVEVKVGHAPLNGNQKLVTSRLVTAGQRVFILRDIGEHVRVEYLSRNEIGVSSMDHLWYDMAGISWDLSTT